MCAVMCALAAAPLRLLYRSSNPQALSASSRVVLSHSHTQRYRSQFWDGRGNLESWSLSSRRNSNSPIPLAPLKARSIATHTSGQSTLKERLHNGEQLYGVFSLSFSSVVAEILGWAGYDYVVVDLEHGPGDTMSAVPILQALASTGTPAIIRLPVNDPVWAKKALDLGPQGIMFPMINDANAARDAVRSCRYPPAGVRGAAYPIVRAARYGLDHSYLSRCEEDLLIMCQIETQQAVDNLKEIAAVDGVDCIQMGPLDLRSDLGLLRVPEDKSSVALLREAEKNSKSSGVYLAGFATSDDSPSKLLQLGYNMVAGSVDVALLRDAAIADIRKAKS